MTQPVPDPRIPPLVSLAEAAEILGVSKQMAHKLVKKNQMRGRNIGGYWVFRRVLVERLAEEHARRHAAS